MFRDTIGMGRIKCVSSAKKTIKEMKDWDDGSQQINREGTVWQPRKYYSSNAQ